MEACYIVKVQSLIAKIRECTGYRDSVLMHVNLHHEDTILPFELHAPEALAQMEKELNPYSRIDSMFFSFRISKFTIHMSAKYTNGRSSCEVNVDESALTKILYHYIHKKEGIKICYRPTGPEHGILLADKLLSYIHLSFYLGLADRVKMYYECDALYDNDESCWKFDSTGEQRKVLFYLNDKSEYRIQINDEIFAVKRCHFRELFEHCEFYELNPKVA